MNGTYDYKRYTVLYVDDEERSLKYFRKAYEGEFRVLTASCAEDAWKVVQEAGDDIGVLITDQRMPGESGVDLLGRVRRAQPDIVRILTTAYSDLDSAIEGVNSGAIYRYVTKPWNVKELKGVLLRAMEFFLVQEERKLLLREKLSVLQRLMITDRVRSLAVLAGGLAHHIRNSTTALKAFLDLAPHGLPDDGLLNASLAPGVRQDLWELAKEENARLLRIVQQVADTTVEPNPSFNDCLPLSSLLQPGVEMTRDQAAGSGTTVDLDLDERLDPFRCDAPMVHRMFHLLLRRLITLTPGGRVTVRGREAVSVWETPGVRIWITGDGEPWSDDLIASFFTLFVPSREDPSGLGIDLLSAFCIVHHHGGDIRVHRKGPAGPGFEVCLPFDPRAVLRPSLVENCLEKLFHHFERWDNVRAGH